MADCQY